jgi:hypothetical protein
VNTSPVDLLAVISGFSIGLAGFAGVVAAVRGSRNGWNKADKFFAGNLIVTSFFSGFIALVTLALIDSVPADWVWRVASGIQAVAATLLWLDAGYRSKQTSSADLRTTEKMINVVIFSALAINVALQFSVFIGAFTGFAFSIFYGGLVLHLFIAAINFYTLIFRPIPEALG